jgi:hypothetical protein
MTMMAKNDAIETATTRMTLGFLIGQVLRASSILLVCFYLLSSITIYENACF